MAGLRPATVCVAVDSNSELGVIPPVHLSTSYRYTPGGERVYPRCTNTPSQFAVARRLARLEKAEAGLVLASGMAAISSTLLALVGPGDHVLLPSELYGGTRAFVASEFEKFGIEFDLVDNSIDAFAARVRPNTRLIYAESPTNPRLSVIDLAALAQLGAQYGALTVVDNTFASPINQNPVELGIDLVLHSGTKYLGGHSDLTCGVVVGSAGHIDRIQQVTSNYGGMLNPFDGYLLERSLKTLSIRIQRQNENALQIARFLSDHVEIAEVLHPGLKSHPDHPIAATQMSGFGGMVTFSIRNERSVEGFTNRLRLITPAISLGGVETTLCLPAFTSHLELTEQEQRQCGVTKCLVRLSTGIEDHRDLIADLDQALLG